MADINALFKQREQLIIELIEFNNNEINRICSLDGGWGSGKSFFIDKFIEQDSDTRDDVNTDDKGDSELELDKKQNEKISFDILKFDAWENQGHGNINAIFLEFLFDELQSREYDSKPYFEYMKDHGKEWIGEFAGFLSESIILKPISKIVDIFKNGYKEFMETKTFEAFGNQFLNQILDEKSFYDILIEMLIKEEKYLIIIDELDRCEPKFAIELIKKIIYLNKLLIKNNNKVNFLISINKVEFANLLIGYYGPSYDTHQYFDKIFDYDFALPEAKTSYEYIEMMIPGLISYRYEIEERVNKIIKDKFDELNYRKLNILVEKLNCPRETEFERKDLIRHFNPGYSYDRTRFILEILKLSDFKEYLEVKSAIIRLRRQHNYSIFSNSTKITIKGEMSKYDNSIDDIKLISKYFTKSDCDDITVDCSELSRESNFEKLDIEEFKNLFSMSMFVLLRLEFKIK